MAALKVPKDERIEQVVLSRQLDSAATVQLHGKMTRVPPESLA